MFLRNANQETAPQSEKPTSAMKLADINWREVIGGILAAGAGLVGLQIAGAFESVSLGVISIIMCLVAIGVTYECLAMGTHDLTATQIKKRREVYYAVSIFVLFGVSWVLASILRENQMPPEPKLHFKVLALLLIPTLVGVYLALRKFIPLKEQYPPTPE